MLMPTFRRRKRPTPPLRRGPLVGFERLEDRTTPALFTSSVPSSLSSILNNNGHVAAADFDGDGKMDVVLSNYGAGSGSGNTGDTIVVIPGDGTGAFNSDINAVQYLAELDSLVSFVAVADLNGDTFVDIVSVQTQDVALTGTMSVFLNDGSGNFTKTAASPQLTGGSRPTWVGVADFNGDTIPDVAVTHQGANDGNDNITGQMLTVFSGVQAAPGKGTGNFTDLSIYAPDIAFIPTTACIADFDGDSVMDIAVAYPGIPADSADPQPGGFMEVLLNDGTGSNFTLVSTISSGGPLPIGIAAADLDKDGKQDIVIANAGDPDVDFLYTNFGAGTNVAVRLGTGNGNMGTAKTFTAGIKSAFAVAIGDFNLDTKLDIAAVSYGSPSPLAPQNAKLVIYNGTGIGTFAPDTSSPYTDTVSGSQYLAVADFDGKGNSDIVTVGDQNRIRSYMNTTRPTTTSLLAAPASPSVGQNVAITATVAITGGYPETPSGIVRFYDGTTEIGNAALANVLGTMKATFNTTSLAAGSHNITAKYDGVFTGANYTGVSLSAISVVTVAGAANTNPTIDSIGNQVVTAGNSTGNIPFTVNDTETLPGNLTLSAASNNLSLIPLSAITFGGSGANRTVNVASMSLTSGSATITITVTDGGGLTAQSQFTVTVNAVANTNPTIDSIGNQVVIAGNSTGNIPFTVNDTETLPGSLTLSAASNNLSLIPLSAITFGGSGTDRTVNVASTALTSGSATITVTVTDGGGLTAQSQFLVTVNPANTNPTISAIGNQNVTAGNSTAAIPFTVGDFETPVGSLTVTAASNDLGLIPLSAITIGGNGTNRTVTVASSASTSGSAIITLTVTDGGSLTAQSQFIVTVSPNTNPTIDSIGNQVVTAGNSTGAVPFTVNDNQTAPGSLTLSAASNNLALIPLTAITFGGSGANRTVNVASIIGTTGSATITVTVHDSNGGTAQSQFTVTVNPPPNTNPTIDSIGNQVVTAGNSTGAIPFTVGDAETAVGSLTLSAASNNLTLVPLSAITFGGSGANRTVNVASIIGTTGSAMITVTVTDGGSLIAQSQFTVTVNPPPNTAPSITDIANVNITAGTTVGPVNFLIGDNQTAAGALTLSVTSSNPALIPTSAVTFGGSDTTRMITVNTVAGFAGSTKLTVTVTDAGGLTASDEFTITQTVPPANTNPTISAIANISVPQDTNVGPIAFTVGDAETAVGSLVVSASSSNPALLPAGNIVFGGSGANRTLSFIPVFGQDGTATITVTVTDGGSLTATETFDVTVTTTPAGRAREFAIGRDAGGTSTVRFFNPDHTERYSATPFGIDFTGGIHTATADFNGDDIADLAVATGPGTAGRVMILDGVNGSTLFDMLPFGANYNLGVFISAGDMTADGKAEIVMTAENGGAARVRIFSPGAGGFTQKADFIGLLLADGSSDLLFRGGGRSAVGDFNGDGFGDLAFAAGIGGGPRIALFDGKTMTNSGGPKLRGDFFAFEAALRNGTYVAAGDVDGDGFAELVAGAGPGGGPRVTVFTGKDLVAGTLTRQKDFFAGDINNRGGIRVAVKSLDADIYADVLVGSGTGGGSRATAYLGKDLRATNNPPPLPTFDFDAFPGYSGGIFVG